MMWLGSKGVTRHLEAYLGFLETYGTGAIFILVFMEHLNLPGLPAAVVLPLAGLWAAQANLSFLAAILITTLAGLAGCVILYGVGWLVGPVILGFFKDKFPRQAPRIDRAVDYVHQRGGPGVCIGRIIPVLRTIISIPAGMLHMPLPVYLLFSSLGVFLYNLAFVSAGYFLGQPAIDFFLN